MIEVQKNTWYTVAKPVPDGRLNTCGFRIADGQTVLIYARTEDDIERLNAVQEFGYTLTHEIRNKKAKARPKT